MKITITDNKDKGGFDYIFEFREYKERGWRPSMLYCVARLDELVFAAQSLREVDGAKALRKSKRSAGSPRK